MFLPCINKVYVCMYVCTNVNKNRTAFNNGNVFIICSSRFTPISFNFCSSFALAPKHTRNFYFHFVEQKKNSVKLSHQQEKVRDAAVPIPIYTAINSKRDVSAQSLAGETTVIDLRRILRVKSYVNFSSSVSEWVEFTPYEIGMDKYGTFMKTELFGSKFFCGKLIEQFPESPLYYLQGK